MKLNKRASKFIASAMVLSLASAGVLAPEAGAFGKLIPTNSISAEAAQSNTYNGWTYEINSNQTTVRITGYTGSSTNLTIPNKIGDRPVTALATGLFRDNTSIKSVTLPSSITNIPEKCFYGATSLEKVTIPSGIETIGASAFSGTTSLKTISLPNTVCTLRDFVFSGSGISSITMPGVTEMGGAVFASCNNLKSFSWPSSISVIPSTTFYNCSNLKNFSIPKTVTKIGTRAFAGSGLQTITLPDTVKNYGAYLFENCSFLTNVNILNAEVLRMALKDDAFAFCDNLTYINNKPIVNHNPKTGEPFLNTSVEKMLNEFDTPYTSAKKVPIIQQYMTERINYIFKNNVNASDSDIVKAKKLHDWLTKQVDYDYASYESGSFRHDSSTDEWAPFLRKKSDGDYYAVCSGYAGAYKLLLDAAGVDCYEVSGGPLNGKGDGHAWNVVKLNGNYYHVDATWDDSNRDHYIYFLRSDNNFASNHEYKWSGTIDGEKKDYQTGIATYDMYDLGDVNDDGEVTEDDALEIQKYLLKTNDLSDEQKMRADINMDGEVKMNDAVSISMALTKMKNDKYTKTLFEYIYIDGKMNV